MLARVLILVREVVLRMDERSDAVVDARDVRVLLGPDPGVRGLSLNALGAVRGCEGGGGGAARRVATDDDAEEPE